MDDEAREVLAEDEVVRIPPATAELAETRQSGWIFLPGACRIGASPTTIVTSTGG